MIFCEFVVQVSDSGLIGLVKHVEPVGTVSDFNWDFQKKIVDYLLSEIFWLCVHVFILHLIDLLVSNFGKM